jgi:hypothetical protein
MKDHDEKSNNILISKLYEYFTHNSFGVLEKNFLIIGKILPGRGSPRRFGNVRESNQIGARHRHLGSRWEMLWMLLAEQAFGTERMRARKMTTRTMQERVLHIGDPPRHLRNNMEGQLFISTGSLMTP